MPGRLNSDAMGREGQAACSAWPPAGAAGGALAYRRRSVGIFSISPLAIFLDCGLAGDVAANTTYRCDHLGSRARTRGM